MYVKFYTQSGALLAAIDVTWDEGEAEARRAARAAGFLTPYSDDEITVVTFDSILDDPEVTLWMNNN